MNHASLGFFSSRDRRIKIGLALDTHGGPQIRLENIARMGEMWECAWRKRSHIDDDMLRVFLFHSVVYDRFVRRFRIENSCCDVDEVRLIMQIYILSSNTLRLR